MILEREMELNRNDFCSTTQLNVIFFNEVTKRANVTLHIIHKCYRLGQSIYFLSNDHLNLGFLILFCYQHAIIIDKVNAPTNA